MEFKEIEIRKLHVQPDEMLLVRLPDHTQYQDMDRFRKKLIQALGHNRFLCYCGDIEFSKVALEGAADEISKDST